MKKYKIFIDGREGTTGLEINERLLERDDVEILEIASDKRKDLGERGYPEHEYHARLGRRI